MNKALRLKILERFDTQLEFSHELRVHPSTISSVIRGKTELTLQQQELWAEKLRCTVKEIFGVERG
jgi:hypothetical protein